MTKDNGKPRLLIAVGGNAIHPGRGPGTVEEQLAYAARTGRALLPIMRADNELVITHGNGPVVGKILMRQVPEPPPGAADEHGCLRRPQPGRDRVPADAEPGEHPARSRGRPPRGLLLTQVEVDPGDPAFGNPTKPVGFFYDESEAAAISKSLGWTMRDDAGRGWRYVVPSPRPKHIVDISLIETVAKSGGGGHRGRRAAGSLWCATPTGRGAASRGSSTRT